MKNLIKKGITLITMMSYLCIFNVSLAANNHSIDLEFDNSQYLSITDADQTGLDITGDLTMEAWVKLEQLPSVAGTSFCIMTKYETVAGGRAYLLHILTADDKLQFIMSDDGSVDAGHYSRFTCDTAFVSGDVGVWKHVAISVDVSVPSATFYIDGTAQTTTNDAIDATSIYNSSEPFEIGAYGSTPAEFFDGLIDDARIWNDIRTSTEIADNYQKELVGNEANLVGYWKLNNDLLDETANNNDLTNNNSAVFSTDVPFTGEEAQDKQSIIWFN